MCVGSKTCEFTFHCTKEVVSSSLSEMFGDETGKAGKLERCVGLTNHTEQATRNLTNITTDRADGGRRGRTTSHLLSEESKKAETTRKAETARKT